jgi:hypothetical protein
MSLEHKSKIKNFIIIKISGPDKSVDNSHCSENVNGAFWRDGMSGNLTRNIQNLNRKLKDISSLCWRAQPIDIHSYTKIISTNIDNRKLLLIRIVLLADSFIFFRFYFYQFMVLFLFNAVIYIFLLLGLCIPIVQLPWLRFFRAFSSVVRQMLGYNSPRRGTARTVPITFLFCSMYCFFVLFYVLFFFVVLCIVCV